jgi:hypothetical protein
MDLRFLTKNPHKATEFAHLFKRTTHVIIPVDAPINEIQTEDRVSEG